MSESAELSPALAGMRDAVLGACATEAAWEAKVVAGIGAAIGFAMKEAEAAATATGGGVALDTNGADLGLVSYFARRLEEIAPAMQFPVSSPQGIVEMSAITIRGHLVAGATETLIELGPWLVHLSLLPYLGPTSARRWAATFSLTWELLRYVCVRFYTPILAKFSLLL